MKKALIKTILLLAAFTPFASYAQPETSPCVEIAAVEFGVPVNVFKALVLVTQSDQKAQTDQVPHFGVMGMHINAIEIAAKGINASVDKIKSDDCTNYRAAAWWLAHQAGANKEADVWVAVNHYFHGRTVQPNSLMVERVKRAYEQFD